ncbi:MAG TPA: (2Fe-2S)-binding protein [Thermomicrobiales bacterium]|jgi:nicotinate dehydrogenase subunit A|nr:(2Fe-2S)-binding protein [Thermomicrobiales bacterium]
MDSTPVGPVTISVNGESHQVEATPDTPLLYILRNELGLHAAKFGCGLAQCGSCTVLQDGQPIRSCVTPVERTVGSEITTLEGLRTEDKLHPVQQAFIEEQAAQCGYCIPGMMMTATALIRSNPEPTIDDINTAFDGNLCRCGTHVRIVRAVQRAAGAAASGTSV